MKSDAPEAKKKNNMLSNKFDQILERAEKQVFGTARSVASPQVRSSVLDLPYRLLERFSTLFGSGPARSETQFQLFSVNRLVWAGAAAVLIVLILAPVVFRSMSEFDQRSRQPAALEESRSEQLAASEKEPSPTTQVYSVAPPPTPVTAVPPVAVPPVAAPPEASLEAAVAPETSPVAAITDATPEEIAKAVRRGLQLLAQGQIAEARQLLLRWGAERDATAALALGMSYDPIELQKLISITATSNTPTAYKSPTTPVSSSTPTAASPKPASSSTAMPNVVPDSFADVAMARTWYQKAKDLGSIEAERRLESLAGRDKKSR